MKMLALPTPKSFRFSSTSEIDGGGSATYKVGQPSLFRLVFWVELGPRPRLVGSGGPGPSRAPAHGDSGPSWIPLHTLTKSAVYLSLLFCNDKHLFL